MSAAAINLMAWMYTVWTGDVWMRIEAEAVVTIRSGVGSLQMFDEVCRCLLMGRCDRVATTVPVFYLVDVWLSWYWE